jgi:hypothetical protein
MTSGATSSTSGEWTLSGKRTGVFAVLLLVDFVIVLVMLATDQNLQSDFGIHPAPPYYVHWYGVLGEGVVDLVAALVIFALVVVPAMRGRAVASRRWVILGGVVWMLVAIIVNISIVESYSMVGLSSESQFSRYLFGVTPDPGFLPYIPWLYDLLLASMVLSLLVGLVSLARVRRPVGAPAPSS